MLVRPPPTTVGHIYGMAPLRRKIWLSLGKEFRDCHQRRSESRLVSSWNMFGTGIWDCGDLDVRAFRFRPEAHRL